MSKLVHTLLHNKSAFAKMAMCAIVALVGSLSATVVDLGWLIGDMLITTHTHHWFVLVGLVSSTIVQLVATIFFYQAVKIYIDVHPKKVTAKRKTTAKVSKQSQVIIHLNARLEALEHQLGDKENE